jgi:hypothetical protein
MECNTKTIPAAERRLLPTPIPTNRISLTCDTIRFKCDQLPNDLIQLLIKGYISTFPSQFCSNDINPGELFTDKRNEVHLKLGNTDGVKYIDAQVKVPGGGLPALFNARLDFDTWCRFLRLEQQVHIHTCPNGDTSYLTLNDLARCQNIIGAPKVTGHTVVVNSSEVLPQHNCPDGKTTLVQF